jgi:hypothetical protein
MPRFESRIGRFLELEIEDAVLTKLEGTLDGAQVGKPHTRRVSPRMRRAMRRRGWSQSAASTATR